MSSVPEHFRGAAVRAERQRADRGQDRLGAGVLLDGLHERRAEAVGLHRRVPFRREPVVRQRVQQVARVRAADELHGGRRPG
jgi:hypothetical protein